MKIILHILLLLFAIGLNAQQTNIPTQEINGNLYYQYTVQTGEGLYRISKNFGTTQSEINSVNPQIHDGLQAGMQILIPVVKDFTPVLSSNNDPIETKKTVKFIEHLVEKKQTVFAICQQYNISQEDFKNANPDITKTKLKSGQIVKIPVFTIDTINTQQVNETSNPIIVQSSGKKFKIAFMLPFMLEQNKTDLAVKRFVEFYSGAVVALQEYRKEGYSFEIFTYDTEKSENKLAEILEDSALLKMDLIIGPAYSSQVSMMGDFARLHKVKTLIPFTSKIFDIGINPWIYQFNPGQDYEVNCIAEHLKTNFPDANVVLLQTNQTYVADENYNIIPQIENTFSEKQIAYNLEILNDSVAITQYLTDKKDNILFFNTSKINQVAGQIRELNQLNPDSIKILIYEPLNWKSSKLERPESFTFSPFKRSFDSDKYTDYQVEYIKLFSSMPDESLPRYDLIGYDIIKYSIPNIILKQTTNKTELQFQEGIQSDIKFVRLNKNSGYINGNMSLIK